MILCARTQSAAFYSDHSGQSPLVLNHIEPHHKDKVGSVPKSRLGVSNGSCLYVFSVLTQRASCYFPFTRRSGRISAIAIRREVFRETGIGPGSASLILALVSRRSGNCRALTLKPLLFHSEIGLVSVNPLQQKNPRRVGQWIAR